MEKEGTLTFDMSVQSCYLEISHLWRYTIGDISSYLEIYLNHLEISLNYLEISPNGTHLEISLNHLEISPNDLEISPNIWRYLQMCIKCRFGLP
jgi:hypothetical protein